MTMLPLKCVDLTWDDSVGEESLGLDGLRQIIGKGRGSSIELRVLQQTTELGDLISAIFQCNCLI